LAKTLLGVDVIGRHAVIVPDASERDLLTVMNGRRVRIIVTPIGGQGYLFGRGNQQISHEVLRRVGRTCLLIVATPGKVTSLHGEPFRVDTGSVDVDAMFAGYARVITGYHLEIVYRVTA